MQIFCVGGTFNETGGRPSGYFTKLTEALRVALPLANVLVVNGGSLDALSQAVERAEHIAHLLWFADVPNDVPKLLPVLTQRYPGMTLVSSKNNRRQLYDRDALFERMRVSRSELLVEFGEGAQGVLTGSVLTAQKRTLLDQSSDIADIAACLAQEFTRLHALRFPLAKRAIVTRDSSSYQARDFALETEIPLGSHPGAFGALRTKHIHEGIDLYGLPGDAVFAMERGVVVARQPFTGTWAGSPWWAETECILVEGASGVLNYGEISGLASLAIGDSVEAGDTLGHLATVLLKDKGRPQTMLHLERYVHGTRSPITEWPLGDAQPGCLRDPSPLLLQAIGAQHGA